MNTSRMFIVSGMVQGVGFRYQTAHHALSLGVTGYAKNLNNGKVEVLACGNDLVVEDFYQWLKQGPRNAHVSGIEEEITTKMVTRDFAIL
ncbi:MAG: acylphosphatase [Vibrio sp.]